MRNDGCPGPFAPYLKTRLADLADIPSPRMRLDAAELSKLRLIFLRAGRGSQSTKRRLKEMNDASTRFAEGQTEAAAPPARQEAAPRVAVLAESALELNAWATEEGLRGATASELFDGYWRRLSAMDFVILRAYVATQTLPPLWSGDGYTWRREINSSHEQPLPRGGVAGDERPRGLRYRIGAPADLPWK